MGLLVLNHEKSRTGVKGCERWEQPTAAWARRRPALGVLDDLLSIDFRAALQGRTDLVLSGLLKFLVRVLNLVEDSQQPVDLVNDGACRRARFELIEDADAVPVHAVGVVHRPNSEQLREGRAVLAIVGDLHVAVDASPDRIDHHCDGPWLRRLAL
eukprot:scaffold291955_cov32-Tisochrysis_lutea.AAC.2